MRKYCKALVNLGVALVFLLLVIFLLPRLLIFFSPFVAGYVIALIAAPPVRFFEEKVKLKRKAGSAFVIIVVLAAVVTLIYFVGAWVIEELAGFLESLPSIWEGIAEDIGKSGATLNSLIGRLPKDMRLQINNLVDGITSSVTEFLGDMGSPTLTAVGNFAKQVPNVIIGIIMALLSAYFFVSDKERLSKWCNEHLPEFFLEKYDILKKSLVIAVGGYFKAQIKIEMWIYLILLAGFLILRIDYAALVALGISILDFLPFFGTGTVMVPWAIIKLINGDYILGIWLLVLWGGGQLIRQLIQPKIVGDSIGVAPVPTLFLLFIGYKVGSVAGMILAVPIGIIAYTMYEEGAFRITTDSVNVLISGVNDFRRLTDEDLIAARRDLDTAREKKAARIRKNEEEKRTREEAKRAGRRLGRRKLRDGDKASKTDDGDAKE
ncbi:MAG: sporulation integral membrane protein YtvI [Lachnospiraceae bacterium]|nr:sporulation integral membrane protein YtvI [Lachnospiraceae bacterium]